MTNNVNLDKDNTSRMTQLFFQLKHKYKLDLLKMLLNEQTKYKLKVNLNNSRSMEKVIV